MTPNPADPAVVWEDGVEAGVGALGEGDPHAAARMHADAASSRFISLPSPPIHALDEGQAPLSGSSNAYTFDHCTAPTIVRARTPNVPTQTDRSLLHSSAALCGAEGLAT